MPPSSRVKSQGPHPNVVLGRVRHEQDVQVAFAGGRTDGGESVGAGFDAAVAVLHLPWIPVFHQHQGGEEGVVVRTGMDCSHVC